MSRTLVDCVHRSLVADPFHEVHPAVPTEAGSQGKEKPCYAPFGVSQGEGGAGEIA